jgi:hypothetical protein
MLLSSAEWWAGFLTSWATGLGALAALLAFLALGFSNRASKLKDAAFEKYKMESSTRIAEADAKAADANRIAAETRERAAKLEREAAQARLELEKVKLKQLPRRVSPEDTAKLKDMLNSSAKGKVVVGAEVTDAEATALARQLKSILADAGFEILSVTPQILALNARGIYMFLKDKSNAPPHAAGIQAAVSAIGFSMPADVAPPGMQRFAPSDSPSQLTSEIVVIWVGQKP